MVPISLYVTIEIMRILQAIFIRVDPSMYDKVGMAVSFLTFLGNQRFCRVQK